MKCGWYRLYNPCRLDRFGLYTSSSFEPHEIRGSTYIQSMAKEGDLVDYSKANLNTIWF